MSTTLQQFFYDLVHWQYFGILAIIWIIVDLIWMERWKKLIERIGKLIKKPWIFEPDPMPDEPPLYPRRFFEQLALNGRYEDKTETDAKVGRKTKNDGIYTEWLDSQRKRVFDAGNPIRSLGYVISLVFFVFFLIADAIVIANTLVLMGVISPDLPPALQRLELAILGGAVLTTIVGVWMLVEMSGTGELINTEISEAQKKLFKLFAVIGTLFSVVVMLALAVQRLINLGYLQSSSTTDLILSFILYGLLAINNSLSAALTFSSAASGLIVLMYLLFVIFPVLAFLFDLLGRGVYIIVDVLMWMILTPIIAIPVGVGKIFSMFS